MSHKRPVALRILEGNPSKRPIGEEPQTGEALPCPEHLTGDARDNWQWAVDTLGKAKIVQAGDAPMLEAMATSWAMIRQADKAMKKDGPVSWVDNGHGPKLTVSPWFKVRMEADAALMRILRECGATPSGRARLATNKPDVADTDSLEAFQRKFA